MTAQKDRWDSPDAFRQHGINELIYLVGLPPPAFCIIRFLVWFRPRIHYVSTIVCCALDGDEFECCPLGFGRVTKRATKL
jgi:hypothetical protein